MPKIFIRTLWGNDPKPFWDNEDQREGLRRYLNDEGFYVLTGAGDSLDVHAVENSDPFDILIMKKALDKLTNVWHTWNGGKKK